MLEDDKCIFPKCNMCRLVIILLHMAGVLKKRVLKNDVF